VASRVFSSKKIQSRINAIVHPRVEEVIEEHMTRLEAEGLHVAIVEAALIFEAGLDKKLDAVVVVDADEETKIARIMKRDGVSRDGVLNRMGAQLSPSTKLRKADYIIYNNGTVEELEEKTKFLYTVFHELADSRR
jgi:dephospho-CoA kinase